MYSPKVELYFEVILLVVESSNIEFGLSKVTKSCLIRLLT